MRISSLCFVLCAGVVGFASYLQVTTGTAVIDEHGVSLWVFSGIAGLVSVSALCAEHKNEISRLRKELETAERPPELPWSIRRTVSGKIVFRLGGLRVACEKRDPEGLVVEVSGLPAGEGTILYVDPGEPEPDQLVPPGDKLAEEE